MCFEKLTEKLKKRMKWYDFSILKMSTLFATLAIVSGWEWFRDFVLSIDWYWHALASVILAAPLLKKMFIK